jgi:hypothetical protein
MSTPYQKQVFVPITKIMAKIRKDHPSMKFGDVAKKAWKTPEALKLKAAYAAKHPIAGAKKAAPKKKAAAKKKATKK